MRLNQKKIEEVILAVLGEGGLALLKELHGKENISEFDLANKTKKDIKVIRKMLYLLYNNNLVGFTRKKDKIKGWYIYYWTLLPESFMFYYLKKRREALLDLKNRLGEGQRELFYSCKSNCAKLNFDQAIDFEFRCPECGELVNQDEGEEKDTLKKKIADIEEELASAGKEERKITKFKVTPKAAKLKKLVKKIVKVKSKKKKKSRK